MSQDNTHLIFPSDKGLIRGAWQAQAQVWTHSSYYLKPKLMECMFVNVPVNKKTKLEMDGDDRLRRASWFNPRLRRYAIKERPKSWVYGNYRKTIQEENGPATGVHKQKPVPPPPPVRSPLTRLQSDPSIIVPAGDKEDKDSEKGLQNKIMNESNRSDKCDVNNTNETGNDPNQEKDFTVEI